MLFDFNQSKDLLTPTINFGGVDKVNPIFTSSDIFPLDDNDALFPSVKPGKNEYVSTLKSDLDGNNDYHQQQQDELFSTFDFPVLSELEKSGM